MSSIIIRNAEPRKRVILLLSFPIAVNPTPGESVGVKLKRNAMILSVGKISKLQIFAKLVITNIKLAGIGRFKSWYERIICYALTIDHI